MMVMGVIMLIHSPMFEGSIRRKSHLTVNYQYITHMPHVW